MNQRPRQPSDEDLGRRDLRRARLLRDAMDPTKPLAERDGIADLVRRERSMDDKMSEGGITK